MTVIAIVLAAVLMGVVPLMAVSQQGDDIAQSKVQAITTEFGGTITSSGKLTVDNYNSFMQNLAATGYSYDVALEFKLGDINLAKASTQVSTSKIGETVYYSEFTSQIVDEVQAKGKKLLKEGDIISVNVKNTNKPISEALRSFLYNLSGNDSYQVAASYSGVVVSTGK